MLSEHQKIQLKNETLFETICRLSQEKDEDALTKIMTAGNCIGVFQGDYNPVMKLAKDGNYEAVEFLIDKFKASLNDAVHGAARGGHIDLINTLVNKGASLNYAVCGAAIEGNVALIDKLISEGAPLSFAVVGVADGGFIELMDNLLSRSAYEVNLLKQAAMAAAIKGHIDLIQKIIERAAILNNQELAEIKICASLGAVSAGIAKFNGSIENGVLLDKAVLFWATMVQLARRGDENAINKLIQEGASLDEGMRKKVLDNAVQTAAVAGHINLVNLLLKQGASLNKAVQGAASGDHGELTIKLINEGASLEEATQSAATAGHIDLINLLIKRGASLFETAKAAVIGGHLEGNQEKVLRFISFIDNALLRKCLIEKANKKNNSINIETFAKKASQQNRLIRKYQLDYQQIQPLLAQGARIKREWLLHGEKLAAFPAEIFIHISSFVLGLPNSDTLKVFAAVNKIHARGTFENNNNASPVFFPIKKRLSEKENEQAKRCKRKIN